MKHQVAVALILFIPMFASANDRIICKAHDNRNAIVISLSADKKFGQVLNCISGDFIVDMTPCAPSGGYGLSAPTGSVELVGVTSSHRDFKNHLGGVVSSYISDDEIQFTGGFMGLDGYRKEWEFIASRLTGNGQLQSDNGRKVKYSCTKVKQKF